jgi:hypothetical protein
MSIIGVSGMIHYARQTNPVANETTMPAMSMISSLSRSIPRTIASSNSPAAAAVTCIVVTCICGRVS